MPSLTLSAWSRVHHTSRRPDHYPTGYSFLALPNHAPRNEEPPFTNGPFDALETCRLECLRVREGNIVSTKSALEANGSQQDMVVSRSKLGKVFRSDGSRHTPVQQGLDHFGLQHSDFQAKRGGCHIIHHRAEPFEAWSHETDPSVDSEREVSDFMDNDA